MKFAELVETPFLSRKPPDDWVILILIQSETSLRHLHTL